jgi:hypothetical protein
MRACIDSDVPIFKLNKKHHPMSGFGVTKA